jgi:guanylate kinase
LAGGRYYGTPVAEFDRIKAQNKNVIMNIDVQGAKQIAKMRDDIIRIFIKPDSTENIKKRMQKAGFSKKQMAARLSDMKRELKQAKDYDYTVVNKEGKLQEAIKEVAGIIGKEISNKNK